MCENNTTIRISHSLRSFESQRIRVKKQGVQEKVVNARFESVAVVHPG
jgi:hypothetical protein